MTTYKQDQLQAKGRLRYLRGGKVLWDSGRRRAGKTLNLGIAEFKRSDRGHYFNDQYKHNAWTPENLKRASKVTIKGKEK